MRRLSASAWAWVLCLCWTAALTGCAGLPPPDREHPESVALPLSPQTHLAQVAQASQAHAAPAPTGTGHAPSGFRLLPLGGISFDARLQLAQQAQASLDVQYYHLANDETGRHLLRALRDAALRGVRVRLLIDDLYTGGEDGLLHAFAAHPGVEVRLFNPFTAARSGGVLARFAAAPGQWRRVNHRMHNKLFIADGALAIMGGRNIANEYFLRKAASENFIDVDAIVAGAVLPPLQALFDRYWHSEAVSRHTVIAPSTRDPAALRAEFEALTAEPAPTARMAIDVQDVLGRSAIGPELARGWLDMHWGPAYVFADHPDKPFEGAAGGELMETSVAYNLFEAIRKAQHSLTLSSPYFIPGAHGTALMKELRERDLSVRVLTNSAASTDEPLAYLGYSRYREALLQRGVQLYELSTERLKGNQRMFHFGTSLGRLHAKTAVIDRRVSYIGSLNLDPRSATINTEIGAVVDSAPLAAELLHLIEIDLLHSAYNVRLKPSGRCCQWFKPDDAGMMVFTHEPDAPWWLSWLGHLLRPLAPEDQL
jgi:cardiolipin synthase C